jgi:hypothetical protein
MLVDRTPSREIAETLHLHHGALKRRIGRMLGSGSGSPSASSSVSGC